MRDLKEVILESISKIYHDEKNMKFSTIGGELTYYDFPITINTNLDALELETVQVKKSYRGKGIGKDLVKSFIDYANAIEKDIVLYASVLDIADDRMTDEQLIIWYKSLGFKQLDKTSNNILWYKHERS